MNALAEQPSYDGFVPTAALLDRREAMWTEMMERYANMDDPLENAIPMFDSDDEAAMDDSTDSSDILGVGENSGISEGEEEDDEAVSDDEFTAMDGEEEDNYDDVNFEDVHQHLLRVLAARMESLRVHRPLAITDGASTSPNVSIDAPNVFQQSTTTRSTEILPEVIRFSETVTTTTVQTFDASMLPGYEARLNTTAVARTPKLTKRTDTAMPRTEPRRRNNPNAREIPMIEYDGAASQCTPLRNPGRSGTKKTASLHDKSGALEMQRPPRDNCNTTNNRKRSRSPIIHADIEVQGSAVEPDIDAVNEHVIPFKRRNISPASSDSEHQADAVESAPVEPLVKMEVPLRREARDKGDSEITNQSQMSATPQKNEEPQPLQFDTSNDDAVQLADKTTTDSASAEQSPQSVVKTKKKKTAKTRKTPGNKSRYSLRSTKSNESLETSPSAPDSKEVIRKSAEIPSVVRMRKSDGDNNPVEKRPSTPKKPVELRKDPLRLTPLNSTLPLNDSESTTEVADKVLSIRPSTKQANTIALANLRACTVVLTKMTDAAAAPMPAADTNRTADVDNDSGHKSTAIATNTSSSSANTQSQRSSKSNESLEPSLSAPDSKEVIRKYAEIPSVVRMRKSDGDNNPVEKRPSTPKKPVELCKDPLRLTPLNTTLPLNDSESMTKVGDEVSSIRPSTKQADIIARTNFRACTVALTKITDAEAISTPATATNCTADADYDIGHDSTAIATKTSLSSKNAQSQLLDRSAVSVENNNTITDTINKSSRRSHKTAEPTKHKTNNHRNGNSKDTPAKQQQQQRPSQPSLEGEPNAIKIDTPVRKSGVKYVTKTNVRRSLLKANLTEEAKKFSSGGLDVTLKRDQDLYYIRNNVKQITDHAMHGSHKKDFLQARARLASTFLVNIP